ncbi:MAG: hypothetical protein GY801_29170 [bacterium]|nr:hypothetical protein [bacterium]
MSKKRVPLYERLPEIYRIKDEEQQPSGQLRSYLALVEEAFGAIHANIESLYHDLFIETCEDWVIPYIGDLLGTSHLKGEPWTLRADVADTIALRRRKGTLGAMELLTYNLTKWGVHCVELRENLVWNQHLNHQRPDEGGQPPYSDQISQSQFEQFGIRARHRVIRGGTVTLRDPAVLSLLNTPFDPFAHIADLKPPAFGSVRYNLPNLAIFLWRLNDYRIRVSRPFARGVHARAITIDMIEFPNAAAHIARFDVHPKGEPVRLFNTYRFDPERKPLEEPVRLFNTYRFDPDKRPPVLTQVDETPGPILIARLSSDSPAGNPDEYVTVETYNHNDSTLKSLDLSEVGLQLHLPESVFTDDGWLIRGANLCAWETGLYPPLKKREIAIDPVIGRIVIGVATEDEGNALIDDEHLLLTYTYGAVGPVGAHPISRPSSPQEWNSETVDLREVNFHRSPDELQDALNNIQDSPSPIVIEIYDSMTHELDLSTIPLNRSLIIRAADNQRPIIKLVQPLRFRPTKVNGENAEEQKQLDAIMSNLTVRLEGLYLTRDNSFPADEPLIARAALHSLEIIDCTLDPGGFRKLDGKRALIHTSMKLEKLYGFDELSGEKEAFNQIPEIILRRTVTGPLLIDAGYTLSLTESIIDAGKGVNDDPEDRFAVSAANDPANNYGPPTQVNGITVFGRMRVKSICGRGGIWVHALEVFHNQKGCIKFSYFSGKGDRLPQNHGCVKGTEAQLRFVSEIFGRPAYGQLTHATDFRIREKGPNDDAMGAFGFLLEAHKWRNLQIRFREFMPVGVRPLLIPVT